MKNECIHASFDTDQECDGMMCGVVRRDIDHAHVFQKINQARDFSHALGIQSSLP